MRVMRRLLSNQVKLYNPDYFNEEYWNRFERLLELSAERNIFVQIEIWAFHDFTGYWPDNPWNPSNNTCLQKQIQS
jgi:hypothetical protein